MVLDFIHVRCLRYKFEISLTSDVLPTPYIPYTPIMLVVASFSDSISSMETFSLDLKLSNITKEHCERFDVGIQAKEAFNICFVFKCLCFVLLFNNDNLVVLLALKKRELDSICSIETPWNDEHFSSKLL
ncbi:hypothetical protein GQ457_06G021080 [Hibiscus cannabinus]